jgi:hypothetical protein
MLHSLPKLRHCMCDSTPVQKCTEMKASANREKVWGVATIGWSHDQKSFPREEQSIFGFSVASHGMTRLAPMCSSGQMVADRPLVPMADSP